MAFELSPDLWLPQRRGIELTMPKLLAGKTVCLYGPTGGGKTRVAIEFFNWALSMGWRGCFYINRKLLVGQTASRFDAAGLPYGIRAADYEDCYDFSAPFQICSADTEESRVFKRKIWNLHEAELLIVDEAHIQKTQTMRRILAEHRKREGCAVLLTATPIGLSTWADELVISGTMKEYRDCLALVPAVVKGIEQPDMTKVQRNKTGEYVLDGKKKAIYTQSIVGNVIDRWKRYNPDARPTMLYAPGVAESIWFTKKFMDIGVNWCHVDATDAVLDGKRATLTRPLWDEILQRYKSGDIKGLSSRMKLREGIDVPNTYHCILATPIGSLASYVQTVGRVLRYSAATRDHVIVTDHGGNYHRFGSPNHDRPWGQWWDLPERVVSNWHLQQYKERKEPEPIVCPQCEGERTRGPKCPHCGFEHAKGVRHVIQEDGTMKTLEGNLVPARREAQRYNTQEKWSNMYWSFRNGKKGGKRTFAQLDAFFALENYYHPPRTLNHMPLSTEDWYRKIEDVPFHRMRMPKEDFVNGAKRSRVDARQPSLLD